MLAGVVLAAGAGTRFSGGNKLLHVVDGDPIIVHAVRTLIAAGLDPVVVVTGFEADAVRDALDSFDVEFVHNPLASDGQSTSVATAVEVLRDRSVDGALIMLGDMPFVDPATVTALVDTFDSEERVVVPTQDGRRGNPVIFGAAWFDRLADLDGDVGGRALFDTVDLTRVPVDDPGIHRDVDTRDDVDVSFDD